MTKPLRAPNRRMIALLTAVIALTAALTATPASAEDMGGDGAVTALGEHGLLDSSDGAGTGSVTTRTGLVVSSLGGSEVSIRPDTTSPGRSHLSTSAVTFVESGFTYVLTGDGMAADAGYAVIDSAAAPTEFRYDIRVGGRPANLEATDGAVIVRAADGSVANIIGSAWSRDADGRDVPTSYSIDGSTLVQHVEHDGFAYPVVADPRLQCNGVFCTWEYRKSETQTLATWGGTAGGLISAGCAALAGALGSVACGLASGVVVSTASQALANKQCFGMRAFIYVPVITTHAVAVPCYA